ncbi:MAG TPA: diguanylate cyclase [Candidatus Acidoferrum sp.]|nr:diguanylate cyclase [Candidatus Acidoferrum sp.]
MKILIADDDALSRKLLEKTLERAGYDVTAVENGKAALEHLGQAEGPRLALLDWVMPGLDGPTVCRSVRKRNEQHYIYMVLLTSKGSKEETVAGLESGADDYLTKPFNAEELRARLRVGERILLLEDRLVEARENMRFRATHDTLTSLLNRGAVLDLLARELQRSYREHTSTVILLGDVDHFKRVNDTLGHAIGDEVLVEIANRLLAAVRSYDFVGRYGGEEFLAVLNGCDRNYAPARAEAIRKSIGAKPIPTARGPVSVTMSFGAVFGLDWGPRPMEELLREADTALYQAKAAGRDCLQIARPSAELAGREVQQPARQRR